MLVTAPRWATFDCYGTLVDWNGGIGGQLERLSGAERAPPLLTRYHELEPTVQVEAYRSYREVLTETLVRLASEHGLALPKGEEGALADSLAQIDVPFDEVVVAEEIGSYKPAHRHWEAFGERVRVRGERHVHVAA